MKPNRRHGSVGFTLVEAMVALSITAIAATALLLGVESSLQTSSDALEQTIAAGMAQQLADEVLGARYAAPETGPYQSELCPSSWEAAGDGRERFNDTDDYNDFRAQPAEARWGVPLGRGDGLGGLRHPNFQIRPDYFAGWRQEIDVYYVSETDQSVRLPAGQASNYRAVEVHIIHQDTGGGERDLYRLRRVYAYVP